MERESNFSTFWGIISNIGGYEDEKRKYLIIVVLAILALVITGCQGTGKTERISFEYDFKNSDYGWTGDFTDLRLDYEKDMYGLEFAHTTSFLR